MSHATGIDRSPRSQPSRASTLLAALATLAAAWHPGAPAHGHVFVFPMSPGPWFYQAGVCYTVMTEPVQAESEAVLDPWIEGARYASIFRCDEHTPTPPFSVYLDWAKEQNERTRACSNDGGIWAASQNWPWEQINTKILQSQCEGSPARARIYLRRTRTGVCPAGDPSITVRGLPPSCRRNTAIVSPAKTLGPPNCGNCGVEGIINPGSGNAYLAERDHLGGGPFALRFVRHYNSLLAAADYPAAVTASGAGWRHSFERSIEHPFFPPGTGRGPAIVQRPDGRQFIFVADGAGWATENDIEARLAHTLDAEGHISGWTLTTAEDVIEHYDAEGRLHTLEQRGGLTQRLDYDAEGRLARVTDPGGRSLSFTWQSTPTGTRLDTVSTADGGLYRYLYSGQGVRALGVILPDDTPDDDSDNPRRHYLYESSTAPWALTGIVDENGQRHTTLGYGADGRAEHVERGGSARQASLDYHADGRVTVAGPPGFASATLEFTVRNSVALVSAASGPCVSCGEQGRAWQWDGNGRLQSSTALDGTVSTYVHDARGLELARTEAAGSALARTRTTEWHADYRLPLRITEPGRITTFTYDDAGRLLSRTETDTTTTEPLSRTTTQSWNAQNLLAAIDGPRTDLADITTFDYDPAGNLAAVTNALGQRTRYEVYDGYGRATRMVDANGVVTTFAYDRRGRLVQRNVDGAVTRFDYDAAGNLTAVTLPAASTLTFDYDSAQRLVAVKDALGNRIDYTLDALGNRTAETTREASGTVRRSLTRVVDALNRVIQVTGGAGQASDFSHDAAGRLLTVSDPNDHLTVHGYDALGRLVRTLDALGASTEYAYDTRDNLAEVRDARGVTTHYLHDGFDHTLHEDSADRGRIDYAYDAAGNRIARTDARGVRVEYHYDALDRLILVDYPERPGEPSEDVQLDYDQGSYGIGRLSRMRDASGESHYAYDARGNLIEHTVTSGIEHTVTSGALTTTLGYAYDAADRLRAVTYPSGAVVHYLRDAAGRVREVTVQTGASSTVLARDIDYAPFGPATAMTLGNGLTHQRLFDTDYRLTRHRTDGVLDIGLEHDAAGNLTAATDLGAGWRSQHFAYDPLDRLTEAHGPYGSRAWAYDANGNRLHELADGELEPYLHAADSNRLLARGDAHAQPLIEYAYDAAGNTLSAGELELAYNQAGRLTHASALGATLAEYRYSGSGERHSKRLADGREIHFRFGPRGELMVERHTDGSLAREYVWLDGQLLAALDTLTEPTPEPLQRLSTLTDDGHAVRFTFDAQARSGLLELDTPDPLVFAFERLRISRRASDDADPRTLVRGRQDGARVHARISPQRNTLRVVLPRSATRALFRLHQADGHTFHARPLPRRTGEPTSVRIDQDNQTLTLSDGPAAGTYHGTLTGSLASTRLTFNHADNGIALRLSLRQRNGTWRGILSWRRALRRHYFLNAHHEPAPTPAQPTTTLEPRWIHTDHLGTPKAMTDPHGAIVWEAWQEPFGRAHETVALAPMPVRFPGQYLDDETGLHYNYFRYYESSMGRYLRSDPIGFAGGMHLYLYANQNPAILTDPSGLAYTPGQHKKPYAVGRVAIGSGGVKRPRVNVTLGVGGSGMFMLSHITADSGIAFGADGAVCFYSNICFGNGINIPLAGSLGAAGGVGTGLLCSGSERVSGVYWAGGQGLLGEGQIMSNGGYSRGLIGVGGSPAGVAAGIGALNCQITYICLVESPGCACLSE